MSKLKIGIFGAGCVGSGLLNVLTQTQKIDAVVKTVVAKNPSKKRRINFPVSYNPLDILEDPEINVVVELISDSSEAYQLIKTSLLKGKHVITANKKVLAEHLTELISIADCANSSLLYEGAVGGSIPIIRNLEEYYNNDNLTKIEGIVNGTTNYILTKANQGISYADALIEAQAKGFAEENPTLDVDGFDPKFKLVLLLKHAFGVSVTQDKIFHVGIRQIKPFDVQYALDNDFRIKLLATAYKVDQKLHAIVAPHFIAKNHSAYHVDDEFNAIIVNAELADKQLFFGKGAGSYPTASAVLSDLSALENNYRYNYKKTKDTRVYFSQDTLLKVYISASKLENILKIKFEQIVHQYTGPGHSYLIGLVCLRELNKIDWNNRSDVSLLIFPESNLLEQQIINNKSNFEIYEN